MRLDNSIGTFQISDQITTIDQLKKDRDALRREATENKLSKANVEAQLKDTSSRLAKANKERDSLSHKLKEIQSNLLKENENLTKEVRDLQNKTQLYLSTYNLYF